MAIKSNSRDGQINGNIQIYLKTSSLERERENKTLPKKVTLLETVQFILPSQLALQK